MKICLISPHFPPMSYPCGASHFAVTYAKNLADHGHDVTVVTSNPQSHTSNENRNFKVEVILGNWGIGHIIKISSFMNSNSFDLFDIQFETYMYGAKGGVLLLPYFVNNKTTPILTMHSEGLPSFGGKLWRLIQYTAFKKVVFYSKAFMDNALKRFSKREKDFIHLGFPSNITKVHNSSLQKFAQKIKVKELEDKPLGIYFGHINKNRGIEDVLAATLKLKANGIGFKLILMSQFDPEKNQYHRDLLAQIEEMGLKDEIAFTGRVDDELVSLYFQASDFALLPFTDGASFKNGSLATAVIHNLPMITTLNEKTEVELKECKGIHFFESGKISELESVLTSFLENSTEWSHYSNEVEKLNNMYSWENYIQVRNKVYGVN